MNWCPQVGNGSIAQFPFSLRARYRAIANEAEDGRWIGLPDAGASRIEWELSYRDLSDEEAARLRSLFMASKGRCGAFGFVDPLANLLSWSEDLTKPDWQRGLLTITRVAGDGSVPSAWQIENASAAAQALTQTVGIPGGYVACFSVWARTDAPGTVTLQRDGVQVVAAVGPAWKQIFVSGAGSAGADHAVASLVLNAGQTVEIWGLQLEAQPYASQYKPTTASGGIYPETYFAEDELKMTSTGVGFTDCDVTLVSRL